MLDYQTHEKKIAFLTELHRQVNRRTFRGSLRSIEIDIATLHTAEEAEAAFFPQAACSAGRIAERIAFDAAFIQSLQGDRSSQIEHLAITMLHEMVHQYCYESGIDDAGHNDNFMDAAERFGLDSFYEDGKRFYECLYDDRAIRAAEAAERKVKP